MSMSASFFHAHFSRSSLPRRSSPLPQRRIESDADHYSMPQRRIESDAGRCCGRDRHHSGGFLLRIMPPSWRPVPACVRYDKPQAGHSSLPLRKLEPDAELVAATDAASGPFLTAATTAIGGTILLCGNEE